MLTRIGHFDDSQDSTVIGCSFRNFGFVTFLTLCAIDDEFLGKG